jgi:hypothetical protein
MRSVRQVGYAVHDVDAAVRQFEALNGPADEISRFQVAMGADCAYRHQGEPATCRLDVALITVGGLDHEFIQVLEGSHPTADFIAEHGEGINHVALYVGDLSECADRFTSCGGTIVAQGEFAEGASPASRFAYFSFNNRSHPLYELVELRALAG